MRLLLSFLFIVCLEHGFTQVNIIPVRTDVSGFATWSDANVAGTTYIQLLTSTSITITPAMDFNAYSSETLDFKVRTFGGSTAAEIILTVSISTDNGSTWANLGTRTPVDNNLNPVTQFDLSGYSGTQVKIRFSVAGTNNSIGVGIDDITIRGVVASTSSFSGVTSGAGAEPSTISSLVNTQGAASMNFDFTVTDDANTAGGNDALPTLISQIVLNQGTGNDIATWTDAIQGAELTDGTNSRTGTVTGSTIVFSGINTATLGNIADGTSKTYQLKIWLKTTLGGSLPTTVDGLNLSFRLDRTNITTASSATSTQMETGGGTAVVSGGTANAIQVVASALQFIQQPSTTNQNASMSPAVTIAAVDANGNRDLNYTSSISVSSTGTLTGSPVSVSAVAGVASFSTLTHTVVGTSYTLTGSSSGLSNTPLSSLFNITAVLPEINLQGNGTTIVDGDATASLTDHTDFGNITLGGSVTRTFTIQNTGSAALSLTGGSPFVAISGANASDFSVTSNPTSSIRASSSTTFTITYTPTVLGVSNATLTILNSDSDEGTYDFAIKGTAVVTPPIAYAAGDFRPLFSTDLSFNGQWEYYNGSIWTTVPDNKAPQNTTTTINRVFINTYVTGGGTTTKAYNCDFIIQDGGELDIVDDATTPAAEMLAANKKIEVLSGGILNIRGDILCSFNCFNYCKTRWSNDYRSTFNE